MWQHSSLCMESIIPKTEFRDDNRLKTLMNFHSCCKNGQRKARCDGASAARRGWTRGRYNQRFSSGALIHESHLDPRHAVPAEQLAARLRGNRARGRRRPGRRSRHHPGRNLEAERERRKSFPDARAHRPPACLGFTQVANLCSSALPSSMLQTPPPTPASPSHPGE